MDPHEKAHEVAKAPDKSKGRERSSLFIGSTAKTFQVLHVFEGPQRAMTLADIARAAELDRSATQRIVHTLVELGYVRRVAGTLTYALTSKVLNFSYSYIRANELIEKASPYLLEISRSLGETTNLHELDGPEIVFVARFPGQHLFNVDIVVGSRLPAFFTASGTAILSRLSVEEREGLLRQTRLEAITPFTQLDPATLMKRVETAAQTGYAAVANETVMGDVSVAAAITDEHGRAVAAINISVPTTRWTLERASAELAQHVQVAATSISKNKFGSFGR
ncbi:IclR family transcriptional regulator [Aliidongia dinghuensis]|uniref:IclR family transcriptional regulator n=1 Tax=Aliidongia dinghuensis TaxID=1867774 RepID=A0A8J2Z0E3_9PROT|nr:IclR family transcriptional regulator [Aliidongia dinghuensis]GGF44294.1 IclR family transcriptional regulator [Aliidongia dinghuensis]